MAPCYYISVNTNNETSFFQGNKMGRVEFLRQAGYMVLLALLSGLLTSEVAANVGQKDDDSWAGDYRGV